MNKSKNSLSILASGSTPNVSAISRDISTQAAAPSDILLLLAAVIVPDLSNTGRSVGILSNLT